jgi:hypothetical protein
VRDNYKKSPKPQFLDKSSAELLPYLNHPNGWWRDNAQKQIIVKQDKSVVPALKEIALGKQASLDKVPSHLARIHALWTLEGLEAIDKSVLLADLKDENPEIRRTAVWISETFLKKGDEEMISSLESLKSDPSYDVRVQLLLSLYNNKSDKATSIVKQILDENPNNQMLVETKTALEKNEAVRTYGARLGNLPDEERSLIRLLNPYVPRAMVLMEKVWLSQEAVCQLLHLLSLLVLLSLKKILRYASCCMA